MRRAFNAQKAGHAGTLDPLATGILPIALGEATKTVPFLMDADKAYRFTIAWGVDHRQLRPRGRGRPPTSDVRPDAPRRSRRRCRPSSARSSRSRPTIRAVKVDGERAYDLAREGEEVELDAAHGDRSTSAEVAGSRTPTTSTIEVAAARAPMSAPWSATWPRRWAPAAMSARCGAPASGRFAEDAGDFAGNAGGIGP